MKGYMHKTVMSKSKFQKGSFRTIDPGRVGHTKLVIGRLSSGKHVGKTRTQAVLLHR